AEASASPLRSTSIAPGPLGARARTPLTAVPPGPDTARPLPTTRIFTPAEPGKAAHTATPTAATPANADTDVATLFACSQLNSPNTTANTVTITHVTTRITRRMPIPSSSTNHTPFFMHFSNDY